MKRIFLFVLLTLTLFACKKDNNSPANGGCRITRIDQTSFFDNETYKLYITYDSQRRIIRLDDGMINSSRFITYQYGADGIVVSLTEGTQHIVFA